MIQYKNIIFGETMEDKDENIYLSNKLAFLNYINKLDDNDFQKLITLIKLIKKQYSDLKIAIKTPNPISDRRWGDYFFALSLKKSLEKKGFDVIIHEKEYWSKDDFDIAIVLRGLFDYSPKSYHLNLMWNISHPNIIPFHEYEKYDVVFVASEKYAKILTNKLDALVHPLLQCTDPEKFMYQKNNEFNDDILFVGFSKGRVLRKIICDILETNHDFSIYGFGWEEFIDSKYIKGQFIDNNILNKAYSSCKILLNDHWEDMVQKDFVSNRIYDALACKTFVISDNVSSIKKLFQGNVVTYTTPQDLNEKLNYYLSHNDEREAMANRGYQIVLKNHTFDNRVSEILEVLEKEYYFKFLNQISRNTDFEVFLDRSISKNYVDLFNEFLNDENDTILHENKLMTIKIAKLEEKILFLEQKKVFDENNKSFNKINKFFKFIKSL